MGSPTPHEVSEELRRVVERWHQLPLDHALSRLPAVRALVQSLADRVTGARTAAGASGASGASRTQGAPVPDLGPAVVMDQLSVMVFDLFRAEPDADPRVVADALAGIRKAL